MVMNPIRDDMFETAARKVTEPLESPVLPNPDVPHVRGHG
jgi:hypothetical protein